MSSFIQKLGKFVFALATAFFFFGLIPYAGASGNGESSEPLIMYSNSASDGRGEWITEAAKAKGIAIQALHIGAADLTNRVIAEKANPVADIVFGPNSMDIERMVRADALQKYRPSWTAEVDQSLVDSKGLYGSIGINPLVFAYNTDVLKGSDVPKDFEDLATNPKFKNKYNIIQLGSGTPRTFYCSFILRYLDSKGQLGASDEGWNIVKQFTQNGSISQPNEDYWGKVISGERPITMYWLTGIGPLMKNRNFFNIDIIGNDFGVPFVIENIALTTKTKNLARAKEFIEWFGTAEVQREWARRFGHIPLRTDAQSDLIPETKNFLSRLKPQAFDWATGSLNVDKWIEKVQLEFVK
jgi:iron(III) transport system substrate-binding protein